MRRAPPKLTTIIFATGIIFTLFSCFFSLGGIMWSQKIPSPAWRSSHHLPFALSIPPRTSGANITGNITIDGDAALDAYFAGNGTDGLTPGTAYVIQDINLGNDNYGIVVQD